MKPLVTVITTVYNAGGYLRPAIQSILAQTYVNFELILIDDGSTDGCVETIRDLNDPRIRRYEQENKGRPASLNRALREARGEFYAIQDADDLSHPRRLEILVECMLRNPDLAGVMSGYELILGDKRLAPRFSGRTKEQCQAKVRGFAMPSHDPTAMYRLAAVRGMEYDPSLPITHAVDYTLRVGERFPMMVAGECLYSYRIHPSSLTKRDPARRLNEVESVLRKACERRGVPSNGVLGRHAPPRRGKRELADNGLAVDFIESVLDQRGIGARWGALKTAWACSRLQPMEILYHKALVYAVVPMWMIPLLRRTQA